MKKETTTAIILGVVFGIIIALLLTFAAKERVIKKKKIIPPKITPTMPIFQPKTQTLEIQEPANGSVVDKNTIVIKGKAEKNSLMIVQSHTAEKALKLTDNNFSLEFPLSLGENLIKITIYQEKNSDEKTLKIYYLNE